MRNPFHIIYEQDCYEVLMHGYVVARIVRYVNGSSLRQEVEFDQLPEDVKDVILDRVAKILYES